MYISEDGPETAQSYEQWVALMPVFSHARVANRPASLLIGPTKWVSKRWRTQQDPIPVNTSCRQQTSDVKWVCERWPMLQDRTSGPQQQLSTADVWCQHISEDSWRFTWRKSQPSSCWEEKSNPTFAFSITGRKKAVLCFDRLKMGCYPEAITQTSKNCVPGAREGACHLIDTLEHNRLRSC